MIDVEKFISDVYKLASVRANHELCHALDYAFNQQGLECKDGNIVPIGNKPKFKVGDWVVNNNGEPQLSQVISRSWPNSKIKRATNNLEIFINTATLDKQYHLWTIQDAKDGDVLVDEVGIILFRKIGNDKYADVLDYHCAALTRGEFKIQKGLSYWGTPKDEHLRPATKEQRERFFAAMHDAGYEWDSEKLELRKMKEKEKDTSHYDNGYQHGFSAAKFNQWKPTDEQMEAFDFYLKYDIDENGVFGRQLVKLYNDLKKLREE